LDKDILYKWKTNWPGVVIVTSNKAYFKFKTAKREREYHYILTKRKIQQEDITIINIYAPNTGLPKHIKQILLDLKWQMDTDA
jgi:hypothetical protein